MTEGERLRWWTGCRMRTLVASKRTDNLVALHDEDTKQLVVLSYEADVDRAVKRGVLAIVEA